MLAFGETGKIVAVNFTWSLPGGLWIRRDIYEAELLTDWISFQELENKVGKYECKRLSKIAYHNGWCGMWYDT